MRLALAPNAFKGSLEAVDVARAWAVGARAWAESRGVPLELRLVPMSDGGDGFLSALRHARPEVMEASARARDPIGRGIDSRWGWDPDGGAAYLESAAAIGLRLVGPAERNPLRATSAGLGRLIRTAAGLGPAEIVVGLGGSATVDGGLGAARELGFRFEDRAGREVVEPAGLADLARVAPPARPPLPPGTRVVALADVDAPLHGPGGAARAFGPQKGADPAAVERLAAGLERLGEVWRADLGTPAALADRPGAGAAGGLGAGLGAFLDAELASGAAWFAERAGLEVALVDADGVVTGEGRFDAQSLGGKATGHVLSLARAAGVPAAVVCASAAEPAPAGVLVVAADALPGSRDRLDAADLGRLLDVVLDRWEADSSGG